MLVNSAKLLDLDDLIERGNSLLAKGASQKIPESFAFNWKSLEFVVLVNSDLEGIFVLEISARIGRLPYSAKNPSAREQALELAEFVALDGMGTFNILPDGRVEFLRMLRMERASSFPELISPLTEALIAARPRLLDMKSLLERQKSLSA